MHITKNSHGFERRPVSDNFCCEQMIRDYQKIPALRLFLAFLVKSLHRWRVTRRADVWFVRKKNGVKIQNVFCRCPGWDFVGLMFYTILVHGKNCWWLCISSSRWYKSSKFVFRLCISSLRWYKSSKAKERVRDRAICNEMSCEGESGR